MQYLIIFDYIRSLIFITFQDLKAKIDQACQTAEEFTKLYYETLDKRRYVREINTVITHLVCLIYKLCVKTMIQLISRMYMETANLIWNGNGISGNDNIQKFCTDLPPSEHTITTLDAQPIIGKQN